MTRTVLAAAIACTALGACTVVGSEPQTIEELNAYSQDLQARLDDTSVISGQDMPTSGSSRYEGIMSLALPDGSFGIYVVLGNLELDVPFAPGAEVTGQADGFVEQSGAPFDGALTVAGGAVDRGGDAQLVDAAVTGTLSFEDQSFGVNRELSGTFQGDGGPDMIAGAVRDVGPVQIYGGTFIVER